MRKRNEHLVVIMLERTPLGEEFEVWPPHITIVPWFNCDTFEKLDTILAKVARRHKAFSVSAGGEEDWGKKEPLEVVLIEDSGQLHNLHVDIFNGLEQNGFTIHQKDFLGEKYKPHVSLKNHLQKGWDYRPGQKIAVNKFALVAQIRLKKSGRMIKSIRKEYRLK